MQVKEEILYGIDIVSTFPDLKPVDKGKYFIVNCPSCGDNSGYIYKHSNNIVCNHKNKCGYKIGLIDYYGEIKNLSFIEAIKELAHKTGISFSYNSSFESQLKEEKKTSSLLQEITEFCKSLLFKEDGQQALQYLQNEREYTKEEIDSLELGYYKDHASIEKHLLEKGFSKEAIEDLDLHKVKNKIYIPILNSIGEHKAYTLRAINKNENPKYLNSKGFEKSSLLGLNNTNKDKPLIIVEGFLDCLIGNYYNLNIASLMGSSITEKQTKQLKKLGFSKIIIALDNDKAGYDSTFRIIDNLVKEGINPLVLDYRNDFLYSTYKDLDELIRYNRKDIESIEKSFYSQSVVSWHNWKALDFIDKHKSLSSDLEKELLLDSLTLEVSKIQESFRAKEYCKTITDKLKLPKDFFDLRLDQINKRKEQITQSNKLEFILTQAKELKEQGKIQEAIELIKESDQSLSYLSFSYSFKFPTIEELDKASKESFAFPIPYETFPEKEIGFKSGAITIISGRPSNGKTSFMLNCALRLAQKKVGTIAYFSYEESETALAFDLISILTKQNNPKEISFASWEVENHFKGNRKNIDSPIEKGIQAYKEIASNRLFHIDYTPYRVDELIKSVYSLNNETNLKAIFIDYIQKISSDRNEKDRYLQIKRVSELLLNLSVRLNIPIILGAQLKRESSPNPSMDSLRESGDIEQDANTILALVKSDMIETDETNKEVKEVTLGVKILKNRKGGNVNRFFPLCFYNEPRFIDDWKHNEPDKQNKNNTLRETELEKILDLIKPKKK